MKYIIVLFLFLAQPAVAEFYIWEDECDKNQLGMNICSNDEYKFYDKYLNKLYKEQINHLKDGGEAKKNLRNAQRAWLPFRNQDCNYMAGDRENSGSIWSFMYNKCLTQRTRTRIQELEAYIECRANGCPE